MTANIITGWKRVKRGRYP